MQEGWVFLKDVGEMPRNVVDQLPLPILTGFMILCLLTCVSASVFFFPLSIQN